MIFLRTALQFGLSIAVVAGATTASCASERVGAWEDLSRIKVEGARQFTAERVRDALTSDLDIALAAHSLEELSNYLKALKTRTCDGYRHCGFPDTHVMVIADYDASLIHVIVDEGARYKKGEVSISGGTAEIRDGIVSYVTMPQRTLAIPLIDKEPATHFSSLFTIGDVNTPKPAAWERGSDVSFTEKSWQDYRNAIQSALAHRGYHSAQLNVTLKRDDQTGVAHLVVDITDLGAPTKIVGIEVEGIQRDSTDDVLKFLAIEPGMPFTEPQRQQVIERLWKSGRFLEQQAELIAADESKGEYTLRITVVECPDISPLNGPLSPEETGLLKAREWIQSRFEEGHALVIDYSCEFADVQVACSKSQGFFCRYKSVARGQDGNGEQPSLRSDRQLGQLLVTFNEQQIELLQAGNGRRYTAAAKTVLNIGFGFTVRSASIWNLRCGLTGRPARQHERDFGCRILLDISPVAALTLAHPQECTCLLDGDILTVSSKDNGFHVKIDASTGELLDFQIASESGKRKAQIRIDNELYEKRLQDESRAAAYDPSLEPNAYDPQRPISSAVEYLLSTRISDSFLAWAGGDAIEQNELDCATSTVTRMVAAGLLDPIDELAVRTENEAAEVRFNLPAVDSAPRGNNRNCSPLSAQSVATAFHTSVTRNLSYGTWPWTISRALTFEFAEKSSLAVDEVHSLSCEKTSGPLCMLALARLPGPDRHPQLRLSLTKRGLDRLTAGAFRTDCEGLIAGDGLLAKILRKAAVIACDLDEEEVQQIAGLLCGRQSACVTAAMRMLRQRRNEPIDEVFPQAMVEAWHAGLKVWIGDNLQNDYVRSVIAIKQAEKDSL